MRTPSSIDRRDHGRRRAKRDETRSDLLHAMQTLLESGETFTQISVARLAAETGMSRTRFYMYFEDLGDLLCSAYAEIVDDGKEIAAKWWDDDGYIERDRMRRILGELVRYRAKHIMVARAVHACVVTDAHARRFVDALKWQTINELQAAIIAAQHTGSVDAALDPAATAGWLGWLLERGVDQLIHDSRSVQLRKVADSLTTIVWNTLYGPTRSSRSESAAGRQAQRRAARGQ
jgi:TetR/AcrR family transcriptional regulator, ethionamide resistance regulator